MDLGLPPLFEPETCRKCGKGNEKQQCNKTRRPVQLQQTGTKKDRVLDRNANKIHPTHCKKPLCPVATQENTPIQIVNEI
ncbi:hypothetical protein [Pannonibacter phragmitetus]|uniref:hypothetical protein n=1 Tax=Pannonibacter phragmitetus TaxID=121719 RepID=UPI003D2EA051